ncbi:hypothetical protein B0F90DRAFT_1744844, partial [Multifurca ochricompacta]
MDRRVAAQDTTHVHHWNSQMFCVLVLCAANKAVAVHSGDRGTSPAAPILVCWVPVRRAACDIHHLPFQFQEGQSSKNL